MWNSVLISRSEQATIWDHSIWIIPHKKQLVLTIYGQLSTIILHTNFTLIELEAVEEISVDSPIEWVEKLYESNNFVA